jgi:hypothetical protein
MSEIRYTPNDEPTLGNVIRQPYCTGNREEKKT